MSCEDVFVLCFFNRCRDSIERVLAICQHVKNALPKYFCEISRFISDFFFSLLFYCLLVFLTLIFCNSSPFLHIEVTMPKAILYVLLVSLFIKALSVSASVIYIYMILQTSS